MGDHVTIHRIPQTLAHRCPSSRRAILSSSDRNSPRDRFRLVGLVIATLFASYPANARAQQVEVAPEGQSSFADEGETGGGFLSRLPINFSVGVRGGYDDNANISPSGAARTTRSSGGGSFATGVAYVSYDLPGQRFSLNLKIGGEFTYYPDLKTGRSESTNTYLDLFLGYNLSERFQLSGSAYVAYRTEPDFSSNVGVENVRSNFFNATGRVSASYNLTPRASLI